MAHAFDEFVVRVTVQGCDAVVVKVTLGRCNTQVQGEVVAATSPTACMRR
jgi:hypothetical protein